MSNLAWVRGKIRTLLQEKRALLPKLGIFAINVFLILGCSSANLEAMATSVAPLQSQTPNITGGQSSPAPPPTNTPVLTPTLVSKRTSSYEFKHMGVHFDRDQAGGSFLVAVAYTDFNRDGYVDAFLAPGSGTEDGVAVQIFAGRGNNTFIDRTRSFFLDEVPTGIHPRKAIVADFNNDGWPDIFFADHGYDKPPFPGASNVLLLSDGRGKFYMGNIFGDLQGFHHGASAADIDNDGDVDVFVTGPPNYFLVNDGEGNLTLDRSPIPSSLYSEHQLYTVELIDIDGDSFVDLIVGGHEYEGRETRIYWGNSSGVFTDADKTHLDGVTDFGIAIDFNFTDLNNDTRLDIIISRPASPPGNDFYEGFYIQILIQQDERTFLDETENRISNNLSSLLRWVDWLVLEDIDHDGDIDLVPDNPKNTAYWINDGEGNFTRQ